MEGANDLRKLAKECRDQAEQAGEAAAENLRALADAYDAEAERIDTQRGIG